jgi:hypothetical protein
MVFAGTVTVEDRDDVGHRVVLAAKGMEQKGKGAANARVTSWLEPGPNDGLTTVKMQADITLTGAAAQLSRGLLPEISKKLTQQFADCLQASMGAEQTSREGGQTTGDTAEVSAQIAPPVVAKPVGGIGLGLSAIWAIISNFFRKLLGLKPKS